MIRNRKPYEWLLPFTFAAMVLVCLYLNLYTGQKEGLASVIVNAVMFILVAVIFLKCDLGCFVPVNSMIADLTRVTAKIRQDAMNSHQFLWEQYSRMREDLFRDKILREQFLDYCHEQKRIASAEKAYYRCDIGEYINGDLTDGVIHRNLLNQVAGAMTGLGILGTFIGLSLGLQSFDTGSTAAITGSISPLMNGIKVAFHTSIYGMIFSLVFNYVYKRKLDDADRAVEQFLSAYRKYVLPDTTTDGVNKLMELEQQQTQAIRSLADTMGHQLSVGLTELLEPQFDRFDETIRGFGDVATRNQLDALSVVVNAFIAEMNKSLNHSFSQLSYTIDQTYLNQQESARLMKEILERTGSMSGNLAEMDRQTSSVIGALETYAANVHDVQDRMNQGIAQLHVQHESGKILLEQERKYLQDIAAYRRTLEASAEAIGESLKRQEALLDDLHASIDRMPKDIGDTFQIIDENLMDVENHFRDTILQIKETTEQVPDVVADAYAGIAKSFDRASEAVDDLAVTIENMARDPYAQGSRR